jgi:hypothetical protein
MKRLIILAVVLFAMTAINTEAKRFHHGVGGYFYTELSPYGSWIEIDYGVVVWRPTIITLGWMPYRTGRWIWTYDGWYWDSYEPFGYITYHYGRWYYDDYYGWLWYPDYEWAPAWVEWRYDNDYIGWAPLSPYATFSISIGIHFTNVYYTPYYHWHFVNYNHFCDPYVYNYYAGPEYRYRIYNATKYRTNYRYYDGRIQNRGVDIDFVRKRTGQDIKQRDLVRVTDTRELKREKGNRDQIRTLDIKREVLERNDLKRMDIKKENKRTSLDINKVEIGNRENRTTNVNKERKTDSKLEIKRNENTFKEKNIERNVNVEKKRTEKNQNSNRNIEKKKDNSDFPKKETNNTNINKDVNRKNNNEQIKKENQNRVTLNDRKDLNTNKQKQNTEIKRENRNNNTQVFRNNQNTNKKVMDSRVMKNETKKISDRTTEKDNSRERNRR